MTAPADIIRTYEECEDAARRIVPGQFLLEHDVRTCVELTAGECGVSYEEARAVLIDHWEKEGG